MLQERLDKANPRRLLTVEEERRLSKLEAIAAKLKRGENVQNRQLQTWLSGRRTGLTNLAERGVGVRVLMALAGHSNMATTQRYIDLRPAMLKAAVELV